MELRRPRTRGATWLRGGSSATTAVRSQRLSLLNGFLWPTALLFAHPTLDTLCLPGMMMICTPATGRGVRARGWGARGGFPDPGRCAQATWGAAPHSRCVSFIMTRTEDEMNRNVGEPQSLIRFLS